MEKPRYEKLMTLNRIEANNLKKTISIIFIFNAVFLVLLPLLGRKLQNKKWHKQKNKNKTKRFSSAVVWRLRRALVAIFEERRFLEADG